MQNCLCDQTSPTAHDERKISLVAHKYKNDNTMLFTMSSGNLSQTNYQFKEE